MGKLQDRVLIAAGRKAIRQRMDRAGKVTRKAAKAGLVVGALVAASVARREVRKHRRAS
jgi:hypothetical protein